VNKPGGELERGGLFPSPPPFASFAHSQYAGKKNKICDCVVLVNIFEIVKVKII